MYVAGFGEQPYDDALQDSMSPGRHTFGHGAAVPILVGATVFFILGLELDEGEVIGNHATIDGSPTPTRPPGETQTSARTHRSG